MIHSLDPVPFTIDNDAHLNLSETQGLLSSDGHALVIEFQLADTVVGIIKTAPREIKIPLAHIQSIRFEKKYLGMAGVITVRARTMHGLQELPDAKLGAVTMKVNRKMWRAAEEFCHAVMEVILRERGSLPADEIDKLEAGKEKDSTG